VDEFRLMFGFCVMLAKGFRKRRIARELRRRDKLGERLLLDGIHVSEEMDELLLRCA
jgi:hypothetical protein